MICWALLEIPLGMHSPFCQIWRIFLPVYHRPSKRTHRNISCLMKYHCLMLLVSKFRISSFCSFLIYKCTLKTAVRYVPDISETGVKYNHHFRFKNFKNYNPFWRPLKKFLKRILLLPYQVISQNSKSLCLDSNKKQTTTLCYFKTLSVWPTKKLHSAFHTGLAIFFWVLLYWEV